MKGREEKTQKQRTARGVFILGVPPAPATSGWEGEVRPEMRGPGTATAIELWAGTLTSDIAASPYSPKGIEHRLYAQCRLWVLKPRQGTSPGLGVPTGKMDLEAGSWTVTKPSSFAPTVPCAP